MLKLQLATLLILLLLWAAPAMASDADTPETLEPTHHIYAALLGPNGERPLYTEEGVYLMEPMGFHALDPSGPGIHLGGGWWLGGELQFRYQFNSDGSAELSPRAEFDLVFEERLGDAEFTLGLGGDTD